MVVFSPAIIIIITFLSITQVWPAARDGFDPLCVRAIRHGSDTWTSRSRSSPIIGVRTGSELEHASGLLEGVPNGMRFRADDCALVECFEGQWAERRGGPRRCDDCQGQLSGISKASAALLAEQAAADRGDAPSRYVRRDLVALRDPEAIQRAFGEQSARLRATQLALRRAERANEKMKTESLATPQSCPVSKELSTEFEKLGASDEVCRRRHS